MKRLYTLLLISLYFGLFACRDKQAELNRIKLELLKDNKIRYDLDDYIPMYYKDFDAIHLEALFPISKKEIAKKYANKDHIETYRPWVLLDVDSLNKVLLHAIFYAPNDITYTPIKFNKTNGVWRGRNNNFGESRSWASSITYLIKEDEFMFTLYSGRRWLFYGEDSPVKDSVMHQLWLSTDSTITAIRCPDLHPYQSDTSKIDLNVFENMMRNHTPYLQLKYIRQNGKVMGVEGIKDGQAFSIKSDRPSVAIFQGLQATRLSYIEIEDDLFFYGLSLDD